MKQLPQSEVFIPMPGYDFDRALKDLDDESAAAAAKILSDEGYAIISGFTPGAREILVADAVREISNGYGLSVDCLADRHSEASIKIGPVVLGKERRIMANSVALWKKTDQ